MVTSTPSEMAKEKSHPNKKKTSEHAEELKRAQSTPRKSSFFISDDDSLLGEMQLGWGLTGDDEDALFKRSAENLAIFTDAEPAQDLSTDAEAGASPQETKKADEAAQPDGGRSHEERGLKADAARLKSGSSEWMAVPDSGDCGESLSSEEEAQIKQLFEQVQEEMGRGQVQPPVLNAFEPVTFNSFANTFEMPSLNVPIPALPELPSEKNSAIPPLPRLPGAAEFPPPPPLPADAPSSRQSQAEPIKPLAGDLALPVLPPLPPLNPVEEQREPAKLQEEPPPVEPAASQSIETSDVKPVLNQAAAAEPEPIEAHRIEESEKLAAKIEEAAQMSEKKAKPVDSQLNAARQDETGIFKMFGLANAAGPSQPSVADARKSLAESVADEILSPENSPLKMSESVKIGDLNAARQSETGIFKMFGLGSKAGAPPKDREVPRQAPATKEEQPAIQEVPEPAAVEPPVEVQKAEEPETAPVTAEAAEVVYEAVKNPGETTTEWSHVDEGNQPAPPKQEDVNAARQRETGLFGIFNLAAKIEAAEDERAKRQIEQESVNQALPVANTSSDQNPAIADPVKTSNLDAARQNETGLFLMFGASQKPQAQIDASTDSQDSQPAGSTKSLAESMAEEILSPSESSIFNLAGRLQAKVEKSMPAKQALADALAKAIESGDDIDQAPPVIPEPVSNLESALPEAAPEPQPEPEPPQVFTPEPPVPAPTQMRVTTSNMDPAPTSSVPPAATSPATSATNMQALQVPSAADLSKQLSSTTSNMPSTAEPTRLPQNPRVSQSRIKLSGPGSSMTNLKALEKPALTRDLITARESGFTEELNEVKELARALNAAEPALPSEADEYMVRIQAAEALQAQAQNQRKLPSSKDSYLRLAAQTVPGAQKLLKSPAGRVFMDRRLWTVAGTLAMSAFLVVVLVFAQLNAAQDSYNRKAYFEALGQVDFAISVAPGMSQAQVLRGSILQALNKHDEAVGSLSLAIKADQKSAEAYQRRGASYLILGKYKEAVADYQTWLNLNPANSDGKALVLVNLGRALMRTGHFNEAILQFDAVLKMDPANVGAMSGKAACLFDKKQYKEALAQYTEILKVQKNNKLALLESGRSMVQLKNYTGAQEFFARAMKLSARDPSPFIYRANMFAHMSRFDRAFEDYARAVELRPRFPESYRARAMTYERQGQYQKALDDYNTIQKLLIGKTPVENSISKARVFAKLNQKEKALEELEQARKSYPGSRDLRLALASSYLADRRFAETITECNKAIAIDHSSWEAYMLRGIASLNNNNSTGAFDDLTESIKLNERASEAFLYRGQIYMQLKMYHGAEEDFTRALAQNPALSEAKAGLSSARRELASLSKRGMTGSITPSNELRQKLLSSNIDVLLKDGNSAYAKGDHGVAVLHLEEVLKRDSGSVEAMRGLALACFACKMYSRSVHQFEKLEKMQVLTLEDKLAYANALSMTGESSRAIALFKEYLAQRPVAANVRVTLAETLASAGNRAEAIQFIDDSLKLSLPPQVAAKLKELKASLEGSTDSGDHPAGATPDVMPAPTEDLVPEYRDPGA